MSYLVLVRHGESQWNLDNKFTGWVDVPLSKKGVKEAQRTAKALKKLSIDIAFTSKLERAQETLMIILSQQKKTGIFLHEDRHEKRWSLHPHEFEKNEIPIYSDEDLNERYYGKLQGKNKDRVRKEFGEKQVFKWRRGFSDKPPGAESLKDVYHRTIPYLKDTILPQLKKRKDVLVSAHGNSLRAIIKFLDKISDEEIPHLELPFGTPIIYEYKQHTLRRVHKEFTFDRPIEW
jgi:2,3-bisphosphoglycerate-dependent phosphoglycerate mutase